MKTALLVAFAAVMVTAAPTVAFNGATQTQAVLAIRGYSGVCAIEVSESPTYSPLIPDVDGAEYSGASTDMGRADTITQSDGTHLVTIGHMNDDRALAAATAYYWRVAGSCGGTVTGVFVTPTVGNGTGQAWAIPFNSSKPWNMGYPTVSLTSPAFVNDPISGVKVKPLTKVADRGWRTGGGANPVASGFTLFTDWAGGTGWTNPTNALNGSTSTASTTNTNPLDLYGSSIVSGGVPESPWIGLSYDDLGAPIWASTSGSSNLSICLFTSPVAGCLGTPITVTPTGSFAKVDSASSDPDHPWPSNFPTPFFNGWGLTAPLGPDHVNTQGTLQCTTGACVIASPSQYSHFPSTMAVGQKIYIAGSSGTCTNNLCTTATFVDGSHITLSENLTIGAGTAFKVYMWGLRLVKTAGTGTLQVGAAYKHAGSLGVDQGGAASFLFNQHGLTTGDSHTGYLFSTPSFSTAISQSAYSSIYFGSADGTTRNLANNIAWTSSTCYALPSSNDMPASGLSGLFTGQPIPDSTDPKSFWIAATNGANTKSLYKLAYSGDLTENLDPAYTFNQYGVSVQPSAGPCGHWLATNIMAPSLGLDIQTQVTTAPWSSVYNATLYGNTIFSWQLLAIAGNYAVFDNLYAGNNQNYPAWIAFVNLTTGRITSMQNTIDGTGTSAYYGGMKWGGLHSMMNSPDLGVIGFVTEGLAGADTSFLFTGPFETTPNAVLEADGVTWDANTCLDWPAGSGTGCAHRGSVPAFRDCPIGNQFEFMGATGTNCITLRIPTGGVCNAFPSVLEQANFPACAWNGAFTNPVPLAAGDVFVDLTSGLGGCSGSTVFLCENLRIISLANVSGGVKVVAQRNGMYDYCSYNPTYFPGTTAPNNGVLAVNQLQHTTGWTLAMAPGKLDGCFGAAYVLNPATGAVIGESSLLTSHGILMSGTVPGSGLSSIAVGTSSRINKTLDQNAATGLFSLPTTTFSLPGPTFQGQIGGIGSILQSYTQGNGAQPFITDAQALNGPNGNSPDAIDNTIGSVTLTHITGDVYTITPITSGPSLSKTVYKTFPLLGWAGRYLLHDVSSPTAGAIDSAPWGVCYVFTVGECHAGSTINTLYVNIPGAYNSGTCNTAQNWMVIPCIVIASPGAGSVRQQGITAPDPSGQASRSLGSCLTAPGEAYQYTHLFPSPDGSFAVCSAHHMEGWTVMPTLLTLPPWQTDTANRTQFGGITVSPPTGPQYAEVQFGYSRYIGPNAAPSLMYCTARAEGCNTSGSPYNFASETRTLTTCTSGCTITLPVAAPNLVYYRVGTSPDGTTWTYGDINAVPVP